MVAMGVLAIIIVAWSALSRPLDRAPRDWSDDCARPACLRWTAAATVGR